MKRIVFCLLLLVSGVCVVNAQIGYQITVFDEAKKEPKANQAVSATVTISDNSGKVICTENVNGTTDEFGILSMQVGNATTFSDTDWSKLPLWISAKVDGVTISKTQILSVPVAEHAKHTGVLTPQILNGKSVFDVKFFGNGTATYTKWQDDYEITVTTKYIIVGNTVYVLLNSNECWAFLYNPQTDGLYVIR